MHEADEGEDDEDEEDDQDEADHDENDGNGNENDEANEHNDGNNNDEGNNNEDNDLNNPDMTPDNETNRNSMTVEFTQGPRNMNPRPFAQPGSYWSNLHPSISAAPTAAQDRLQEEARQNAAYVLALREAQTMNDFERIRQREQARQERERARQIRDATQLQREAAEFERDRTRALETHMCRAGARVAAWRDYHVRQNAPPPHQLSMTERYALGRYEELERTHPEGARRERELAEQEEGYRQLLRGDE